MPIVLLFCSALMLDSASAKVVVESIPAGSAFARAGVEVGDVLESWGRTSAKNRAPIDTPLDFEGIRLEEAHRGSVELYARRRGESLSFVVEPGNWAVDVRPAMTEVELRAWAAIHRDVADHRFEAAIARVARVVRATDRWELGYWWWMRTGELLAGSRAFDKARSAQLQAGDLAQDRGARALVRLAAGRLAETENDLARAQISYRSAFELNRSKETPSLMTARLHIRLGKVAWARGDLAEAGHHRREALATTRALAPHGYILGQCLNDAAELADLEGDTERAQSLLDEAHLLLSRLAPLSEAMSDTMHHLSRLERKGGRLASADRHLREALEIAEALTAEKSALTVASRHRALGDLRRMQGDLATAEDHVRHALSIEEVESPGGLQLALSLTALADILDDGGRDSSAELLYRRALRILDDLGNEFMAAHVQGNLATILAERGELGKASDHFRQTLEIYQRLTPRSLGIAWALHQLGLVAIEAGEHAEAESYLRQARTFLEREAPNHVFLAITLVAQGRLARQRHLLDEAERLYLGALEVYANAGTALFAERARHGLGLTLLERGQVDRASAELERAVAMLEERLRVLGGSRQAQGSFRARHREIYDDALATALSADRPEQAFHLMERSRARSLLEMLTDRDLDFALDLPPDLMLARRDLERRQRQAADRALAAGNAAGTGSEQDELARLREEQESLEARLRHVSPRFAAVRHPVPHGVAEARDSLDAGTVLLAFNVASHRTDLFILTPEAGLAPVVTLPVGARDLRQRVESYLDLLTKRRDPRSPFFDSLAEAGRELYDLLIAPAAPAIERGTRVLIVPDGALRLLPFAALVRPDGDYFVAWRPLHTVLSSTLYARLQGEARGARQPVPSVRIAAFGDPLYPSWLRDIEAIPEPQIRSAVRGGRFGWNALPHTRREVEALAGIYPPESVLLHLGPGATEEAVHALEPGIDLVHFAVHGHLDDRFPLNSALALTVPEKLDGRRHNGLLQAWEIFDSVRLDADLVVLSACATALGEERGGEGLVGLVHAFHYAGARSLLASLWNVNDRITAELMIRFHRHLRRGLAKDDALREAQLELIRGPIEVEDEMGRRTQEDAAAPYYWAAFQILGRR